MSQLKSSAGKHQRDAHLGWVPIALMSVNPLAQRELNQHRVDKIAANFDPEDVGTPTVSHRGEHFYIIDGQHRIEAMKQIGWDDQQVQCWVYEGMTEEQEAERFLKLNDTLVVDAMSKFKVGVQAGRDRESDIDRVVRTQGCVVSREKIEGAIGAVGTLGRIYDRGGPGVLGRAVRIVRDAFGDGGYEAAILDGVGLVCGRYNGQLDDDEAVRRLRKMAGGSKGLLNQAEARREKTGQQRGHCVAATVVDVYNRGRAPRSGARLTDWFKGGES